MKQVRLYNVLEKFPCWRQLPASAGADWGYRFFFGHGEEPCDYLVCYDQLAASVITSVPRERRLLIIGEPPCITRYPATYLNQFGTVLCPYELPAYTGRQVRVPALWWYYGLDSRDYGAPYLDYEQLAAAPVPEKRNLLAAICSNKNFCARHRDRRDFVSRLQQRLGDRMVSFGPGFRPLPDKRDGIEPFAFQLVIENNDEPGFWTEKLADAYLGHAFPFFVGGPGVEGDFPEGAFIRLDIRNFETSVGVIEAALAADLWRERLPLVLQAREKILGEYNAFSRIRKELEAMPGVSAMPPPLAAERLASHWECRKAYHFRDHLNHMAIKHLPFTRPIFKF